MAPDTTLCMGGLVMQHVNMKYTHLGLLHLLWAMLSGGFLILICFAIYGSTFTDDFKLLLDKLRGTPFQWPVGIIQILCVLGLVVGLFFLASKIGNKGSKNAARVWLVIGTIALAALFLIPIYSKGIYVVKEGVFHHALFINFLEPYLLIALMLLLLVVMLGAVYRKSFTGMAVTLFTGTLVWTLSFAAYGGLNYLGLGYFSFAGPAVIFLATLGFYFFRPIGTRRASLSKDMKRLKTLVDQLKKDFPKMDMTLVSQKYSEAQKGSMLAVFSDVGYERSMRKMDEAFEAVYEEVKKYFQSADNNTRPLAEAFGHVRALKKKDVKITELEKDIARIETFLAKGNLEKAKEVSIELKTKARGLKDLHDSSRDLVTRAEQAISRLRTLGADDDIAEKGLDKATKAFTKGKYEDASMHARLAADEGNATADMFERLLNLLNTLENRIHNKENYRLYTGDIEEEILMVKDKLQRGVAK